MAVLIVMCLGILAGRFLVPKGIKKGNEIFSLVCTFILIFSMGVKLGRNDNLLQDLSSLGISSLLYFVVPTVFSIFIVFVLTKKFMKKKTNDRRNGGMK